MRAPLFSASSRAREDEFFRCQRAHAVVHGYQAHVVAQCSQSVTYGVEPFAASGRDLVCRNVEACRNVAPQRYVLLGQHYDDACRRQRLAYAVDGVSQHGAVVQHQKLLGHRGAHSAARASGHYYHSYSSLCHMSFFPNPSVLSVYFSMSASSRHRARSASAA